MSGRSPSGVASLRARFEGNKDSTSPPSRGRSPAGSATSDHSRPISKVRTSFVSVEGSGRMGDLLDPQGAEGKEVTGQRAERAMEHTNEVPTDKPHTNGDSLADSTSEGKPSPDTNAKEEPRGMSSTVDRKFLYGLDGTSDANPDKPVSTAEEETATMLPADPKEEAVVSGGAGLPEDTAGLGSILKGSPFEKDEGKKDGTPKSSKAKDVISKSQPQQSQTKSSTNGLTNGKAKEAAATSKSASQPKTKAPTPTTSTQARPAAASAPAKSANGSTENRKTAARPSTLKTDSLGPAPSSNGKASAGTQSDKSRSAEPRTPSSATAPTKTLTPNKSSPRQGKLQEPKKEVTRDTKASTSRPSGGSKPAPAAAAKPSSTSSTSITKPARKPSPASPKASTSKVRPKSPTRPARLPAAATAPTAASAAKLDGAPPSTADRKPMNYLSVRDQVHSNQAKAQSKPARTSLPARSKPEEKPKASKPRQSMANSKAPEGSFLDRMMRPTQSSSQKTHEKVEVKSPPRKQQTTKPKRVSEGSDKSKADNADTVSEPAKEPAAPAASVDQPPPEASEDPKSSADPAENSISAAAHTVPPTIPVP